MKDSDVLNARLASLARLIAVETDMAAAAQQLLSETKELLNADFTLLTVIESGRLSIVAGVPLEVVDAPSAEPAPAKGVIHALTAGRVRVLTHGSGELAALAHALPQCAQNARSLLCVPLSGSKDLAGALILGWNEEVDVSVETIRLADIVACFAAGIAQQKRYTEALEAGERRYRNIVETANEGIMLLDSQQRLSYVNERLCDLLGYEQDELLGRPLAELLLPPGNVAFAGARRVGRRQFEVELAKGDGSGAWVIASVSPRAEEDPSQGLVVMVTDLTGRKQAEEALSHQALHDGLTGLPNRALLIDRLQQSIAAAERYQYSVALLLMDLDRFKEINDTFGHHYGDLVLLEVASRIKRVLRSTDTVARIGGDEFAILLPHVAREKDGAAIGRKVLRALEQPLMLETEPVEVGASIGLVFYPQHGQDADTLLRRADAAMYSAKRNQDGLKEFSADEDEAPLAGSFALVGDLRRAIDGDGLVLHYQPKVTFGGEHQMWVEALVRFQHPKRGLLGPDEFVPLAERTGLIRSLTRWVLNSALAQCHDWQQQGYDVGVAVNVSMRDLLDASLPDTVRSLLRHWDVTPGKLTLELTETSLLTNPQRVAEVVSRLSSIGVLLSIDDFGAGYASLSYIRQLPVRQLKIDKSFVGNMMADDNDAVIVRSTIELAHNLGLEVVAEGVESRDVWDALASLECDLAQGFYVARPLVPARALEWLKTRTRPVAA